MKLPVNQIICGDNMEVMSTFPDNSIDTIITDAPYEISFMSKSWDGKGIAFSVKLWQEALRVAKPGCIMLIFGGTRTSHRLACAVEDAGWLIRDKICWIFASGFPKSLSISKAIDKAKGAYIKGKLSPNSRQSGASPSGCYGEGIQTKTIDKPQTDLAKLWDGWGIGLKPAYEDILVCMKPLDGTYAQNAEKHGVAGLNIDGSRIGTEEQLQGGSRQIGSDANIYGKITNIDDGYKQNPQGRFPANLILDEEAAELLDEQSGVSKSTDRIRHNNQSKFSGKGIYGKFQDKDTGGFADSGGSSRFFFCAKSSKRERNMGGCINAHPT